MSDVAKLAGVSLKTVSNVVNDYPYIKDSTRARVEQAIESLGYQMNASARNLRRGRTGLISLAIPELTNPYFAELAEILTHEAESRGLRILLELHGSDPERERNILTSPDRSTADALIYSPLGLTQNDAQLLSVNYPLVVLGERIFGADADHVTMSNIEGAKAATEFLISHGAHRIAVVGHLPDPDQGSDSLRFEGYTRALLAAGRPIEPELILSPSFPWKQSTGASAVFNAIKRRVEFDALFVMNDAMALGALHALQQCGITVPDDVQVIGFDNITEGAYSTPALTTISPGTRDIARSALDLVEKRISGSTTEAKQLVKVPFEILERGTTKTGNLAV